MDLDFGTIQKMSVVCKAIQKVISAMLKCGHYFTCGTKFSRAQLCLNNPEPKKCTLLCLHLHLFQHRRQKVSSIPFLHVTATCGFKSLGCMYLGQRQSSKLNLGLLHAWPQSEFSLCDQACSQLPCNASWQGRGGVKKKKNNHREMGTMPSFHRVKNWSPWEKQMFGTANPSALSHPNSVRWSHPVYARICCATEHRDRFLAS